MEDELDLCPGCFQAQRTHGACARCGYTDDPDGFPSALRPGTELSKYAVGRVLGKPGGFGITYLAFDRVLQRRVAIKELMPRELVTRRPDGATVHAHTRDDEETFKYTLTSFLKEARLLAQVSHPNVVRVLDYFEANGTAYFAMEYYEGLTLAEHATRAGGRLSGNEAATLMLPVLDALEHIHKLPEPILHRDIKPANIYLAGKGKTPILLDFGAARVTMGHQTRSLSAVLTPGFAPYEQYATRGKQGPWSDVYACAASLYAVVTGRMPPEANDRVEDRRVTPPRALVPDLAPHISDAILSGLGFRPEERPQSARMFADLISGRQAPLPATEQVPSVPPHAPFGAPGIGDLPRTIVEPGLRPQALGQTEIAPRSMPGPPVMPPPIPVAPPSQTRRSTGRLPMLAVAAAAVLVVAVVWGSRLTDTSGNPQRENTEQTGGTPNPPIDLDEGKGGADVGDPAGRSGPARPRTETPGGALTPDETKKQAANSNAVPTSPADQSAGQTTTESNVPSSRKPEQPPSPPPPQPGSGVLVVIRGDDADGIQRAESTILRSLIGRNGLRVVDADSLSMMRGDRGAVAAAADGDFAALASLGRQHGVEIMVVGELRSRAAPSLNRFFTGTAELTLRMYRVSTSQLVDTDTFTVGPGGGQPVLAVSEGEARSRAAAQAADAAARGVGIWLARAF